MGERARSESGAVEHAETIASGAVPRAQTSADVTSSDLARTLPGVPPQPGDRYDYLRELGRGGMGVVDEVVDRVLGRSVARKSLQEGGDPLASAMLVAEAETGAQLEHPSIVPVYDLDTLTDGRPYYTMRAVRGRSLREVLGSGAPRSRLLGILRQVCLAVDYAHTRGVVHRDLKPENVVTGEFGEVYVIDWGIAFVRAGSDVRRAMPEVRTAGSPGYMAPEQALGEEPDARADVFALGVMLYEILAGTRPFEDRDAIGVFARATTDTRAEVPSRRASSPVTDVFDALVTACLARSRDERPASARVIADAIDAFLDEERALGERMRHAERYVADAHAAEASYRRLLADAGALGEAAEAALRRVPAWAGEDEKRAAWDMAERARLLATDAASRLALAEIAFGRALGHVNDHAGARRGLTDLYVSLLEGAELEGDFERMVHYRDAARAYDDGARRVALADEGDLEVVTDGAGARFSLSLVTRRGPLLVETAEVPLEGASRVAAGSYVVIARRGDVTVRDPIVVKRAHAHRRTLRWPAPAAIPEGLVFIPSGPFLARDPGSGKLVSRELDAFALGRFPVTFSEYFAFLSSLSEAERARRMPRSHGEGYSLVLGEPGAFRLAPDVVEGPGRARVPPDRELDLPLCGVTWFDALGYLRWLAETTGRAFRLPTALEWEKAARGVDGRAYPMATVLDPAFAKLRESRPEPAQPEVIGAFSLDVSPYGVRDLAGGVADWTATPLDGGAPPTAADEGAPSPDGRQMIWCGGTFGTTSAMPPSMRFAEVPDAQCGWIGLRVALSIDDARSELSVSPIRS